MSLRAFHIVFVSLSVALALVFGAWSLRGFGVTDSAAYLASAVASFAAAAALVVYGVWFWRKIRSREQERARRRRNLTAVPTAALVWLGGSQLTHACSVCYGDAAGPMIDAAKLGVWLLFGLVLLIQVGFGAFFVSLYRRARRYRREHPDGALGGSGHTQGVRGAERCPI